MSRQPLKSCLKKGSSRPSTPVPRAPFLGCVDLPGVETPQIEKRAQFNSISQPPYITAHLSVTHPAYMPTPSVCTAVNLHKTLILPTNGETLVIFDVAKPSSSIHTRSPIQKLSSAQRDKLAAHEGFTSITLGCVDFPSKWKIKIKRDDGIRCGDIFDVIYEFLRKPLSEAEINDIPESRRSACEKAFKQRCRKKPVGLSDVELKEGMRRVDYLAGKSMFGGIYLPDHASAKLDKTRWMMRLIEAP
ncbi:hypothetical protein BD410DRAFT_170920 [Rickenella mellea]|uniref:DUF6699 domain-containing protein n=1 Tax=Rickenella mellea TaxID=50990 RepID=A0A4Y7Q8M0_9AGAM|nr:hypothetical protein BD410DRAFT_170920 [Rickenella mellea]